MSFQPSFKSAKRPLIAAMFATAIFVPTAAAARDCGSGYIKSIETAEWAGHNTIVVTLENSGSGPVTIVAGKHDGSATAAVTDSLNAASSRIMAISLSAMHAGQMVRFTTSDSDQNDCIAFPKDMSIRICEADGDCL